MDDLYSTKIVGPHVFRNKTFEEFKAEFEFSSWQSSNIDANISRKFDVLALDGEMSYTSKGLELTRLTVVSDMLEVLIDDFVDTEGEVVDFNTRYSGIKKEVYEEAKRKSIQQVQKDLFALMHDRSILVGHSLDSDLKALRVHIYIYIQID
jgi:RNA exonuclease 1